MSDEAFFVRYANEVADLYGYVATRDLELLPAFYRRHGAEIQSVVEEQIRRNAVRLARGQLPTDSVLQVLIRDRALATGPQDRYAERITEIATSMWRTVYSGRRPADEAELQQELEGAVAVAKMDLEREHPLFTFASGVRSKPDFSGARRSVFVEVKYVRLVGGRSNLQPTTDAIIADIGKYRTASDLTLFLIYDPDRLIKDPVRYIADLETSTGVLIRVI